MSLTCLAASSEFRARSTSTLELHTPVDAKMPDVPRELSAHLMVAPSVSRARSTASGLAAMAVMNMAEEMQDVWKSTFITYAPIFFSVPFFCAGRRAAGSEQRDSYK